MKVFKQCSPFFLASFPSLPHLRTLYVSDWDDLAQHSWSGAKGVLHQLASAFLLGLLPLPASHVLVCSDQIRLCNSTCCLDFCSPPAQHLVLWMLLESFLLMPCISFLWLPLKNTRNLVA